MSATRKNPATQDYQGYYPLVESYRNEFGRVCLRTLHTIGFVDCDADVLIAAQSILNCRMDRKASLFTEDIDPQTLAIAEECWAEMIKAKKIDVSDVAFEKSKRMIDADTIKLKMFGK